MASAKHTPMSKELLANIHRSQLMNGQTNNVHKEAILLVLGGIDGILQHLLTSNAVLHEQQIDSLHLIIANTPAPHKNQQTTITNAVSQRQEDKTDIAIPTLTYTFKDEDSLLFTIFGQENARKSMMHIRLQTQECQHKRPRCKGSPAQKKVYRIRKCLNAIK
eukprot:195320_1